MAMEFTFDDRGLSANLAGASAAAGAKTIANMRLLGAEYVRDIRAERLSGQMLSPRTGQGRRSIFYRLDASTAEKGCDLIIGADLSMARYMRAQALGAQISPRRGQWLTIPIGDARTAKGVARFTARQLFANPGAVGYASAFIAKNVIFGVKAGGRGSAPVPLFLLRKSTTLPSRDYLQASRRALEGRTRELLEDILQAAVTIISKG